MLLQFYHTIILFIKSPYPILTKIIIIDKNNKIYNNYNNLFYIISQQYNNIYENENEIQNTVQ